MTLDILVVNLFMIMWCCVVQNVAVDTQNIEAMQHNWYPRTSTPKLWPVVRNQLINNVHTKYPVFVIIYDSRYPNFPTLVFSPYETHPSFVEFIYTRTATILRDRFILCATMNVRNELDNTAINPAENTIIVFVVHVMKSVVTRFVDLTELFWWLTRITPSSAENISMNKYVVWNICYRSKKKEWRDWLLTDCLSYPSLVPRNPV